MSKKKVKLHKCMVALSKQLRLLLRTLSLYPPFPPIHHMKTFDYID